MVEIDGCLETKRYLVIKYKKWNGNGILFTSDNFIFTELQFVNKQINGMNIVRDNKGIAYFRGNMVNDKR